MIKLIIVVWLALSGAAYAETSNEIASLMQDLEAQGEVEEPASSISVAVNAAEDPWAGVILRYRNVAAPSPWASTPLQELVARVLADLQHLQPVSQPPKPAGDDEPPVRRSPAAASAAPTVPPEVTGIAQRLRTLADQIEQLGVPAPFRISIDEPGGDQ